MDDQADAAGCACGGALNELARCRSCGRAARVKQYRLERTLAQHPHSRVYVGSAPGGARVAVKELLFSLVPTVQHLEAFEREAAFLAAFEHPHTPRFIESFSLGEGIETRLYLVQEFIEGESLLERLQRERVLGEAFDGLVEQLLPILSALHERRPKIIHRDLKPANLVFRATGEVVLVDFGSARLLESAVTHGSTMVGTFGYMPTEQLGGTVDETSDLHALGATLLHAATGREPTTWLVDGLRLEIPRDRGLTSRQVGLLTRLTAPRRGDRFPSALAALAWWRRPVAPRRSRIVPALLAACALVTLGAAVALRDPGAKTPAPASPAPAVKEAPRPTEQTSPALALDAEALNLIRFAWGAEKSYFAERDMYSEDPRTIGFLPDTWCPDGARLAMTETPAANEAQSCHFIAGVFVEGTAPSQTFTAYARGATPPVLGQFHVMQSDGPQAGVLQHWTRQQFDLVRASHPLAPR